MNVLTKLFVVLMTIFAIALVSLIVPHVANEENYRDQRDEAQAREVAAKADAAAARALLDASRKELNNQIDTLRVQLDGQIGDNNILRGDLADSRGEIERLRGDLSRAQADLANMTAANRQFTSILEGLETELKTRRDENTKQAKIILELEQANNELNSSRAAMNRLVRLTREQLVAAQEEVSELMATLSKIPPQVITDINKDGTASGDDNWFDPEFNIYGQVTEVRSLNPDTMLVQINIGANSGVKKNMRFRLHRGDEYVASMKVLTVDEQRAAGQIQILRDGATVQAGDEAWAGPGR